MRLSTISFAGTARTEVAVGISKLASILVTTRADVPFSFSITSSASAAGAGLSAGVAVALAWTGGATAGVTAACVTGAAVAAFVAEA